MVQEIRSAEGGPLVSVIIVNWNGKHLLEDCLGSLMAQTWSEREVILVDNGSSDGSVEYVTERYPEVRVVRLGKNRGFAGGNNAGMGLASGKYVALINNDTKADPEWLSRLVETAEASSPSTGMWASKILVYDRPTIIDNVGLLLYRDGLGRGKGRGEDDNGRFDLAGEAFFPSGCAAMYRLTMIREIGMFDDEFFAYADDVDLGLRARLSGWGCRYVPTARVYHKYSASSSAYSPFKAFLVERNRIWVLMKYFPLELVLISPYYTIKRMAFHFYGALRGRGASGKFTEQHSFFAAIGILMKAWAAALLALPKIVRQRRSFSRIRRLPRAELYRLFRAFGISAREIALKE